jgi:hypothetical protein
MIRLLASFLLIFAFLSGEGKAQGFGEQQSYVVGAGSANAQTASFPNATTIADLLGVPLRIQAGATNTAGMTLTVNSFSAQNVLRQSGGGLIALAPGNVISGQVFFVVWDGTQFELTNPIGVAPTRQVLTTGTTYTTPTGAVRIHIREAGGGGGGGNGTGGGNTSFNSVVANGGATSTSTSTGGVGGTGGTGSGTNILRIPGGNGQDGGGISLTGSVQLPQAAGGTNPWGGGGPGAGGGGAYLTISSTATTTGGGGAGEWVEFDIGSPTTTYTYAIGAAGTAGANNATAGKAGNIVVDEYYQ